MKVYFTNIGRTKASFVAETDNINYSWLYSKVKPYLMSSDIDFSMVDETHGKVYAGLHCVGEFYIKED